MGGGGEISGAGGGEGRGSGGEHVYARELVGPPHANILPAAGRFTDALFFAYP